MTRIKHIEGWIKANSVSILVALIGVLLMVFSKIVEERWPYRGESIGYVLEHLGAVLIVGMLVRVLIEEGYQKAFFVAVNEEVKNQIRESIDKTSKESLQPLNDALVKAKDYINQLDKNIQQLATSLTYKIIQNRDPSLRKVLEDGVLNSLFVRPEYALSLELKPFLNGNGSHSDILELSVITSYKVTNQSDRSASYLVVSWLDDDIRPSGVRESQFTRFVFGPVDDVDGKTHLLPTADILALEQEERIFERNGALHLNYEIHRIEKGSTYEVIVAGKQLMHRNDTFVWNVVTLTNQIDVTVELSGGITQRDLDIFPRAIHHAAEQADIDHRDPTKVTMKLHQIFLPYQGIEVRWSPHVERKTPPGKLPQAPTTASS